MRDEWGHLSTIFWTTIYVIKCYHSVNICRWAYEPISMDLNSKLIWVHLRIIFFCSCCFSEHVAANLFECTSNRTRVKRESLKWACVLDKAYVRSLRAVFAIGFDDHLGNVYFFRTQVVHLSCGYPKSLYNPSTDIKDLNCSETISLSVPDWKQRLNWFKKLIFSSIMCHTHTHT